MHFQPRIDGWIPLNSALNRSNSVLIVAPLSAFEDYGRIARDSPRIVG